MGNQEGWRFCHKCSAMFFVNNPGRCFGSGRHDEQGFDFVLPFDVPEVAFTQQNWRFCNKCTCMFFGGNAGHCIEGGGHEGSGSFNFVLQHDVPEAPGTQKGWRFCKKCSVMFFGGKPGPCVQLGNHEADGFTFVLPHGSEFISPTVTDLIILTCLGNLPGPRLLEGRKSDGTVRLARDALDNGARWRRFARGNIWILECLGDPASGAGSGPFNLGVLDGSTVMVLTDDRVPGGKPVTWRATPVDNNSVTLECRAAVVGPRFLDGQTQSHDVVLSPDSGPQFTGTHWKVDKAPVLFDDGTNTIAADG